MKSTNPTSDECYLVKSVLKVDLHVGSEVIDVACLRDKYSDLQLLELQRYSYAKTEMLIGQDASHAIRTMKFFATDSNNGPLVVRFPLGCALSGPLPPNSCLSSTCFENNIENVMLADQLKRGMTSSPSVHKHPMIPVRKPTTIFFEFAKAQLSTTVNVTKWESYGRKIIANFRTITSPL